jgi:hypothetical protein
VSRWVEKKGYSRLARLFAFVCLVPATVADPSSTRRGEPSRMSRAARDVPADGRRGCRLDFSDGCDAGASAMRILASPVHRLAAR